MQKRMMLKITTAVILLILAPAINAARGTAKERDLHNLPLNTGIQKLPDQWTNTSDIHLMTTTGSLAKLIRTAAVTKSPNGDRETVLTSHRLDKTTSSPSYVDKVLGATKSLGRQLKIASVTVNSNEKKIMPATNRFDRYLKKDPVIDDHEAKEHATTKGNSFYKRLKLITVTTDSNKQTRSLPVTKNTKMSLSTNSPDRRKQIMKILSVLEELHRSMNSTLSSRLTIIPRSNGSGRNLGKKGKMVVTEGSLKSTTMSYVARTSTSPRPSTDQADFKIANGKAFKKSFPTTTKKTNKRVCFWKYCSQN